MKIPLSVILIHCMFSCVGTPQALAFGDDVTVDDMLEFYNSETQRLRVQLYFRGLGSGLIYWNGLMHTKGVERLFCLPADKELHADDYVSLYKQEYIRNQEIWDAMPTQPPGMILIEGLVNTFPCR